MFLWRDTTPFQQLWSAVVHYWRVMDRNPRASTAKPLPRYYTWNLKVDWRQMHIHVFQSFFFPFFPRCQKKVFSSNKVPSSISTSALTNQQSCASSVGALAWMAFLWIELTDAISANDCCFSVVVFTKEAVWSNATVLYPKRACRNKACARRISFWHINRAKVAEWWTQRRRMLGNNAKLAASELLTRTYL